jgi:hypothetical protein
VIIDATVAYNDHTTGKNGSADNPFPVGAQPHPDETGPGKKAGPQGPLKPATQANKQGKAPRKIVDSDSEPDAATRRKDTASRKKSKGKKQPKTKGKKAPEAAKLVESKGGDEAAAPRNKVAKANKKNKAEKKEKRKEKGAGMSAAPGKTQALFHDNQSQG